MDAKYKEALAQQVAELIDPILLGGDFEVDICKEADQWRVNISGSNLDILVGDSADVLRSLQHLLRVKMHSLFPKDRTHFLLDINDFRANREKLLKERARLIADLEVLNNGSTLILVGLSSYERRIVHNLLVEIEGLETTSVGQGSGRKLLIRPTSEIGSKGMDAAKVIDIFSDKQELKS